MMTKTPSTPSFWQKATRWPVLIVICVSVFSIASFASWLNGRLDLDLTPFSYEAVDPIAELVTDEPLDRAEDLFELARRYEMGMGVDQSVDLAASYYLAAANMGHAESQFVIGNFYHQGRGVNKEPETAVYYYHLAAIQGHPGGLYNYGVSFEYGQHNYQSYEEAYNYYKAAAKLGHPQAHYRLGLLYYSGQGCARSFKKAKHYLELAAEKQVPDAYHVLGLMYERGDGVEASPSQAQALFAQAKSKGFSGDWKGEHLFDPNVAPPKAEPKDEESYADRIEASAMSEEAKAKARMRLRDMNAGGPMSAVAAKWLEGVLKIPFGKYVAAPVNLDSPSHEIREYMDHVRESLDRAVYGQDKAKDTLMRVVGQWIANGGSQGEIIGIQGPPGVGKTALAKKGIAEALDRPFVFISLSGLRDGSHLKGSDMVYLGSEWGAIADGLMTSGVMNPVIFIDELDKVSQTQQGRELIGTLIALTDRTQNDKFQDAYFRGVDLDLSRALVIFSFNDESQLDPILWDRMIVIHADSMGPKDKIVVAQDYLLPEILQETGFEEDAIIFKDEDIVHIVREYSNEAGVRRLREKLLAIVRNLNLQRLQDPNMVLPHYVTRQDIIDGLGEPEMVSEKVGPRPTIGVVHGLYATTAGEGGITRLQVSKKHSTELLDLELTGNLGTTMQESMSAARTVAWNLLPEARQRSLSKGAPFGLHIHAVSTTAAIHKDGPSAGMATTLAIYSRLMEKAVPNDLAITGEIDLEGRAVPVGGIDAKLRGAKLAGATRVVLPEGNRRDVEKFRQSDPEFFQGIEVLFVEDIHGLIRLVWP